ncbi:hypothetical protein [Lacticaseibacillus suihuaensis]
MTKAQLIFLATNAAGTGRVFEGAAMTAAQVMAQVHALCAIPVFADDPAAVAAGATWPVAVVAMRGPVDAAPVSSGLPVAAGQQGRGGGVAARCGSGGAGDGAAGLATATAAEALVAAGWQVVYGRNLTWRLPPVAAPQ